MRWIITIQKDSMDRYEEICRYLEKKGFLITLRLPEVRIIMGNFVGPASELITIGIKSVERDENKLI